MLSVSEKNNLSFIETSALDSTNVEAAFQNILTGRCISVNHTQGISMNWAIGFRQGYEATTFKYIGEKKSYLYNLNFSHFCDQNYTMKKKQLLQTNKAKKNLKGPLLYICLVLFFRNLQDRVPEADTRQPR
jgi:hypothetical protein